MLKITICVGSSCSVHGSEELAVALEKWIEREQVGDQVELVGAFCMETCSRGVSIKIGERQYSGILPQDAERFFHKEIMPALQSEMCP